MIEAKDREQANEEHKDEMTNYDNEANGDRGANDASNIDSVLVEAKLESTVDIFGKVLNQLDEEQLKLKYFTKFQDIFQVFQAPIEDRTNTFHSEMKGYHLAKVKIIQYCRDTMTQAERKAEQDSILKIEEYKKHEKHIYRRIEKERASAAKRDVETNHDDLEVELDGRIKTLQKDLLEIEIVLQDALKTAQKNFGSKVNAQIELMKAATSLYIEDVKKHVQEFNEKFKEAVNAETERFRIRMEEVDIDEITKEYEQNMALLDVLTEYDNETLATHLEGFREATDGKISLVETYVTSGISQDWAETKKQVDESQHARSRDIIQEILENTKKFGEENRK